MSFSNTSRDIRLEDRHVLAPTTEDYYGNWRESKIDLNTVIGNYDGACGLFFSPKSVYISIPPKSGKVRIMTGMDWATNKTLSIDTRWLLWGGKNFAETASNIGLNGTRLTAELKSAGGWYRERQELDLDTRIGNSNGSLVFVAQ
ncbi:Cyanovirin-N [Aspergillus karnatakaensis]|uniref:CVNH domain-containing protein n=1 Tax=Aspergillus karnatakaensis TaxID=1810916 RepID=UPI003CCD0C53